MELLAIRHTTPAHVTGICYGRTDVDLADSFPSEASEIATALRTFVPDAVYSSPLQRCLQLAHTLGFRPQTDARLLEMNMGHWEGKPWGSIRRQLIDQWAADVEHFVVPGGESYHQVSRRVLHFLSDVYPAFAHSQVLVFTHAGIIRAMYHLALEHSGQQPEVSLPSIAFGSLHQFAVHEPFIIKSKKFSPSI